MKPIPHGSRRHALPIFPFLIFLLQFVAVAPSGAMCPAQQTTNATAQTLPNDSNTQRFTVTVTGSKGGFITGLTKDDFSVWEGKTEREINYFSSDDVPASVGVLIDVSGSVRRQTLDAVKHAVAKFVERSHPGNEYFIGEFNEGRRQLLRWTRDAREISKGLETVAAPAQESAQPKPKPRGQTAFYDACAAALDEVARRSSPKRVLLLITDGMDNSSRLPFTELRRKVKESSVQLYGLSIIESNNRFDSIIGQAILDELVLSSGGRVYFPGNKKELDEVIERLTTELRYQYVIGFTPTNAVQNGGWNKVKIKVTPTVISSKGLVARSREGYFSPAP